MAKRGVKPNPGPGKSQTEELYSRRTDATLSESAKIFRDAFVREYIKDFDGKATMARLGHTNPKTAGPRACQMLREPYVAQLLDETVRTLKVEDVVTRQQVMAGLWKEANSAMNLCGTRVTALTHLGKMLGMYAKADAAENATPVGVMMIPCSTPEEWAAAAPVAQAVLKARAATHQ